MITVMGATGNTGRKITELLLDAGEEVRALGRSPEKLAELEALGAETLTGDVRDAEYLARAFAGADAVYTLTAFDPTLRDYHADQDTARRGDRCGDPRERRTPRGRAERDRRRAGERQRVHRQPAPAGAAAADARRRQPHDPAPRRLLRGLPRSAGDDPPRGRARRLRRARGEGADDRHRRHRRGRRRGAARAELERRRDPRADGPARPHLRRGGGGDRRGDRSAGPPVRPAARRTSWWRSSPRPPGSRPTSPPCSSSSTRRSAKAGSTRSRAATSATRPRPSSRSSPLSSHTPTRRRRDAIGHGEAVPAPASPEACSFQAENRADAIPASYEPDPRADQSLAIFNQPPHIASHLPCRAVSDSHEAHFPFRLPPALRLGDARVLHCASRSSAARPFSSVRVPQRSSAVRCLRARRPLPR